MKRYDQLVPLIMLEILIMMDPILDPPDFELIHKNLSTNSCIPPIKLHPINNVIIFLRAPLYIHYGRG